MNSGPQSLVPLTTQEKWAKSDKILYLLETLRPVIRDLIKLLEEKRHQQFYLVGKLVNSNCDQCGVDAH